LLSAICGERGVVPSVEVTALLDDFASGSLTPTKSKGRRFKSIRRWARAADDRVGRLVCCSRKLGSRHTQRLKKEIMLKLKNGI
jgi:hypothetical protein